MAVGNGDKTIPPFTEWSILCKATICRLIDSKNKPPCIDRFPLCPYLHCIHWIRHNKGSEVKWIPASNIFTSGSCFFWSEILRNPLKQILDFNQTWIICSLDIGPQQIELKSVDDKSCCVSDRQKITPMAEALNDAQGTFWLIPDETTRLLQNKMNYLGACS